MAAVFRIGQRVQEVASPHRKGSVRAVQRSGPNATIVVNLDGRAPTSFKPAQLVHL